VIQVEIFWVVTPCSDAVRYQFIQKVLGINYNAYITENGQRTSIITVAELWLGDRGSIPARSLRHRVQTGSFTYPSSYKMGTGSYFAGGKAVEV
jgi:hypothetical protein